MWRSSCTSGTRRAASSTAGTLASMSHGLMISPSTRRASRVSSLRASISGLYWDEHSSRSVPEFCSSRSTASTIVVKNGLPMPGTTMPMVPVVWSRSALATAFGW